MTSLKWHFLKLNFIKLDFPVIQCNDFERHFSKEVNDKYWAKLEKNWKFLKIVHSTFFWNKQITLFLNTVTVNTVCTKIIVLTESPF